MIELLLDMNTDVPGSKLICRDFSLCLDRDRDMQYLRSISHLRNVV